MNNTLVEKKFECFEIEIKEKIAHIILNRPEKMNSMPPSFWSDLPEIINEIDNDALARVIVISSTGKHFSAGMDLSVFGNADPSQKKEKPKTDLFLVFPFFVKDLHCQKQISPFQH